MSCFFISRPLLSFLSEIPAMAALIKKLFESSRSFFIGGDKFLSWWDHAIIKSFKEEVGDARNAKNEDIVHLMMIRCLFLSRKPAHVSSWIKQIQAFLDNSTDSQGRKEKLYLLAVGHYRIGDYEKSRHLLECCLEIAPDWRPALTLKKILEGHFLDIVGMDGALNIGIAGLVVCGIVTSIARKR